MKIISTSSQMSLIALVNHTVSLTTTAASPIEIATNKLDRLDTLQLLTDQIMHEDAELLRALAKH